MVTPPRFNVGIDMEPLCPSNYSCSLLGYKVDRPERSKADPLTQDELEIDHPALGSVPDPRFGSPRISGDTGIHRCRRLPCDVQPDSRARVLGSLNREGAPSSIGSMFFRSRQTTMPALEDSSRPLRLRLPGSGQSPFWEPRSRDLPGRIEVAISRSGCFWGERFWNLDGVYTTAVGYQNRFYALPDLRRGLLREDQPPRRCWSPSIRRRSATSGCSEVFFRARPDPGDASGNDVGTSAYRSAVFTVGDRQKESPRWPATPIQRALNERGSGRDQ